MYVLSCWGQCVFLKKHIGRNPRFDREQHWADISQREKSNIFFSPLTWTPPETSGVSKDAPLSTKLGFGGLVL